MREENVLLAWHTTINQALRQGALDGSKLYPAAAAAKFPGFDSLSEWRYNMNSALNGGYSIQTMIEK